MYRHEGSHKKPYPDESSLKSLQTDLAKSHETYKYLENTFEQLRIKALQITQNNQNNSNPNQKPSPITFKKSKYNKSTNSQLQ